MYIKKIAKYPITVIGATSVVASVSISLIWKLLELEYDDGALGTFLFVVGPLIGFVRWLPSEVLLALYDSQASPFHGAISGALGIATCFMLDIARHRLVAWISRLKRRKA